MQQTIPEVPYAKSLTQLYIESHTGMRKRKLCVGGRYAVDFAFRTKYLM